MRKKVLKVELISVADAFKKMDRDGSSIMKRATKFGSEYPEFLKRADVLYKDAKALYEGSEKYVVEAQRQAKELGIDPKMIAGYDRALDIRGSLKQVQQMTERFKKLR